MQLKQMQNQVDEWISQFEEGYWPPLVILAQIIEEIGELSKEIKHKLKAKTKRKDEKTEAHNLEKEIGDILFALSCLANSLNINLDECFKKSMKKFKERDSKRYKRK